ncbi:EF-hand domain-containing protein [Sphingosinicella sp.]|uniref:EF-hand domain-containing protein n=1 Tax=Sphingosinicella sp. TaxID=1917971 RepID=UPI0040382564
MSRTIFIAGGAGIAVIAAAAGIAIAQPGTPEGPRAGRDVTRQEVITRVDERFTQMDANRDGRVTPDERRAARERRRAEMADRMFDRIDANRDGSISREEMREGRMQRGRRGMRMAGPGGPGGPGAEGPGGYRERGPGMRGPRGMGAREVTREEMRERALARFDRMDANRDGTLTMEERRQARDARRERMRMRREES